MFSQLLLAPILVVTITAAAVVALWVLCSRRALGLGPRLLPRMAYSIAVRNFVGYFSTPTGYVFLCLFVGFSSFFAFTGDAFFANNLANLDQLSIFIPMILLAFIPAITMSVWAEEQQQGTDELLLTLPGTDWEIVLGKFVAAAAIYTASLLFSFLTNFVVLNALSLGDVDLGMFATTYLGYWFLGLAMISFGMCASFLTSNLTVAFILGVLFNLPLAFLGSAQWSQTVTRFIEPIDFGLVSESGLFGWLNVVGLLAFVVVLAIGAILAFTLPLTPPRSEGKGEDTGAVWLLGMRLAIVAGVMLVWVLFRQRPFVAMSEWVTNLSLLFLDFSRGVVSLAAILFFVALILVGLFISLALIGRRHWLGGRDGESLLGHYLVRTLAVVAIAVCLVPFLSSIAHLLNAPLVIAGGRPFVPTPNEVRLDLSDGGQNSVSPDTRRLLAGLNTKRPVRIEAFIGGTIPEPYLKTRLDLLLALNEFRARGGQNLDVQIYDGVDLAGGTAERAETQYGIKPEVIQWRDKVGAVHSDEVLLGAAVTCGLQRVVIPFFSSGVPIEYELVRSVATAAQEARKKIGIVKTEASLMGGYEFDGMQPRQRQRQMIVDELEKQYVVEEADPSGPLVDKGYDVLLVVQPSSLAPQQLAMVAQAVEAGVPTAIFEDPYPIFIQVPGTDQPKRGRQQNPFMPSPPEEKGNVREQLLSLLGIELVGSVSTAAPTSPFEAAGGQQADVIWQKANPYPKVSSSRIFSDEFVFVYPEIRPEGVSVVEPFSPKSPIVSGMNELLFPFPGALRNKQTSNLNITPLVATGGNGGKLAVSAVREALREMNTDPNALERRQGKPDGQQYILAAVIEADEAVAAPATSAPPLAQATPPVDPHAGHDHGEGDAAGEKKEPAKTEGEAKPAPKKGIKVVYVSDIDMLANEFLIVRSRPEGDVNWKFQNVPFVLNVLDYLAGDNRFLGIRKRETQYNSLRLVERASDDAWAQYQAKLAEFDTEFDKKKGEAEQAMKDAVAELQKGVEDLQKKDDASIADLQQLLQVLSLRQKAEQQKFDETVKKLQSERKRETDKINRQRDANITRIKDEFKAWAVFLPPIPPLLVALIVYLRGLARESEIVPRNRRV